MGSPVNQIGPNGTAPYTQAWNYGQLIGSVSDWNPSVPIPTIEVLINDAVRSYYDRRLWFSLLVKGQIVSPGYYAQGNVSIVQGSNTITGTNTNWTYSLGGQPIIGQQIRLGFTAPILTITGADLMSSPQTLTVDLSWPLLSVSNTGYFICKSLYSLQGIKYVLMLKDLQLMRRIWTNIPQSAIDKWDPSRLTLMFPTVLASAPPDPSGNWVGELWPTPNSPASYPYLAYMQPQNLVNDTDNLPPYIRGDIVKLHATAHALQFRPKSNPNYSEQTALTLAEHKMKEYEFELEKAANMDEALFRRDVETFAEMFPLPQLDMSTGQLIGGSMYRAMSSASVDDGGYW